MGCNSRFACTGALRVPVRNEMTTKKKKKSLKVQSQATHGASKIDFVDSRPVCPGCLRHFSPLAAGQEPRGERTLIVPFTSQITGQKFSSLTTIAASRGPCRDKNGVNYCSTPCRTRITSGKPAEPLLYGLNPDGSRVGHDDVGRVESDE